MRLGELPQHQDFHILEQWVEKRLDNLTRTVLSQVSIRDEPLEGIRYTAGWRDALLEVQRELQNARERAG